MSQWTDEEREEYLRRRTEGSLAGPGMANTGLLNSFVSLGTAKMDASGAVLDDFIEAPAFEGSKEGFVFKMGKFGLGYYSDGYRDDFDVNAGLVPAKTAAYDMEAHARGEIPVEEAPKEPGHGRVGTLGELLAENKAKKQETFEAMVHANRFCPPKALDEEEEAFLAEKDEERRTSEIARKKADKDAEIEYKMAVAQQSGKDDKIDLAKLMGQSKDKKKPEQSQSKILSRMVAVKRKVDYAPDGGANKQAKTSAPEPAADAGSSLLGLADYGDSDDED